MASSCSSKAGSPHPLASTRRKATPKIVLLLAVASALALWASTSTLFWARLEAASRIQNVPINAQEILAQCISLRAIPGPPQDFHSREVSDRYEPGTNATLIKNAMIFTGEKNGSVVIHGNIFLDKGIVKSIGKVPQYVLDRAGPNVTVLDAKGAWVTPGLVDLHSHLGLLSAPVLAGATDLNAVHGPIEPWLRSIDGFNTRDDSFELAIAGGVTSAQVLPGSGNAIGGQAFVIKLRKTSEGSPTSMIIEPPDTFTGSKSRNDKIRWRYLKQACGENLRRYGNRMDSMWALRSAYNEARKVKHAQEAFCAKAEAGLWDTAGNIFPGDLKWEALVDVLRGRVKITSDCYEVVDLDDVVRLSNEFEFPIASFQSASEAWLVPELVKKTWGGAAGIALFATNHRSKRESFRGSEFAPRVLADAGIPVIMKSDHPFMNSRYLLYEAQQAHYFGLPANLSLAAVTSTPATIAGLSHRIGYLREGTDADVVMWDSHPLQLGATPVKVWIDGILQIPVPSKTDAPTNVEVGKGKEDDEWREEPDVPNWDKERKEAIKWEGLPPLGSKHKKSIAVFSNVKTVWTMGPDGYVQAAFTANAEEEMGTVVVEDGQMTCAGTSCIALVEGTDVIDLHGGSISPGLMTFGSSLGLEEIAKEPSTGDGQPYDAFAHNVPDILDDPGAVLRAMDALMFGTRNALTAYRSGVTLATSSLGKAYYLDGTGAHVISGLSATFRTGAAHAMEPEAIVQDIAALHIHIGRPHPLIGEGVSVSTQIAALRRLLFGWETKAKETGHWFRKAAEGVVPLVVEVENADIMAMLLILKIEVEDTIGSRMRMVFSGASEAHLLAKEIGDAGVGVILRPARPFPSTWDQRRILPGPPLTNDTALVKLLDHGVTVALGVREAWEARNTRFDIQWAVLESNGKIDRRQMHALAYTNLPKLLGVREDEGESQRAVDMVAYDRGGAFDFSSKVVAVISSERQQVDLF
ncbi:putative amidohydrolase [Lyophyllum shimeji]|uniref:Amidohydrolase n=1 Tax=Lyophyllum shimeji TaxID=47721 RepID=A0A9P3PDN4_LYOSH|nr:putative amidohydrolase [Lyophyllum shimeji]